MKTILLLGACGVGLYLLSKLFQRQDDLEPLSKRYLDALARTEERRGIDSVCWNWDALRKERRTIQ